MLRAVGAVLAATGIVVLVTLAAASTLRIQFCAYAGPQHGYSSLSNRTYVSFSLGELQVMAAEGFRYLYRSRLTTNGFLLCYNPLAPNQFVTVNLTLQGGRVYLLKLGDRALVEPMLLSPTLSLDKVLEVLEKRALAKAELSGSRVYTDIYRGYIVHVYEASLEVEPGAYYAVTVLVGEVEGEVDQNCTRLLGIAPEGSVCKVASPTSAQIARCLLISALGALLLAYDLRLEGEPLPRWISLALGALRRAGGRRGLPRRRGSTS